MEWRAEIGTLYSIRRSATRHTPMWGASAPVGGSALFGIECHLSPGVYDADAVRAAARPLRCAWPPRHMHRLRGASPPHPRLGCAMLRGASPPRSRLGEPRPVPPSPLRQIVLSQPDLLWCMPRRV